MSHEQPRLEAGKYYIHAEVPGYGYTHVSGETVPGDGEIGFATGCIFSHLDGGDDTSLYANEGDQTSCNFDAVSVP